MSSRMIALLGLLAVAGYQNRERLGEMLGGIGGANQDADRAGIVPGAAAAKPSGLGGLLGGLFGGGSAGEGVRGGLSDLIERVTGSGHGETARSWVETGPNRELNPEPARDGARPRDDRRAHSKNRSFAKRAAVSLGNGSSDGRRQADPARSLAHRGGSFAVGDRVSRISSLAALAPLKSKSGGVAAGGMNGQGIEGTTGSCDLWRPEGGSRCGGRDPSNGRGRLCPPDDPTGHPCRRRSEHPAAGPARSRA